MAGEYAAAWRCRGEPNGLRQAPGGPVIGMVSGDRLRYRLTNKGIWEDEP
jgi:hypothetical protein